MNYERDFKFVENRSNENIQVQINREENTVMLLEDGGTIS